MSDVYLWETYDKLGREALERRDLEQAEEAFRAAVSLAESFGPADPRLVMALRGLATTTRVGGELGRAHELLRRTLEVCKESLGGTHGETRKVLTDLAQLSRELGFLDQAAGYYNQVLAGARQASDDKHVSQTLAELARLAQERGQPQEATTYWEQLVELRRQEHGEQHVEVAQALLSLSGSLAQAGRSEASAQRLREALTLLETVFADEPEHLGQSLLAGAELMADGGMLEEAYEQRKRAIDLFSESLGAEHARVWEARELVASSLASLGRLEQAVEVLEYCLEHRGGTVDHRRGGLLKNLAALHLAMKQEERAEELYQEAADILGRTLGKDHPAYLATQEERIQLYHFNGRSAEALKIALECIRATELRFGGGHPNTAQVYAQTALLAHAAKEWETALELMRAAEKIWTNLTPVPKDVLVNCRLNIATCLVELERHDEARETLAKLSTVPPQLEGVVVSLRARLKSESGMEDEESLEALIDEATPSFPDLPEFPQSQGASVDVDDPSASETPSLDLVCEPEPEEAGDSAPEVDAESEVETVSLEVRAEDLQTPDEEPRDDVSPPPVTEPEPDRIAISHSEDIAEEPPAVGGGDVADEEVEGDFVSEIHFDGEEEESPRVTRFDALTGDEEHEMRIEPRKNLTMNRFFMIKLTDPESGEVVEVKSFLADISMGGVRVNSEGPLPLDRSFIITLPAEILGQALEMEAQVVWQRALFGASYIQGLQFYAPTLEQSKILAESLEEDEGEGAGGRQHYRLYHPFPIQILRVEEEESEWLEGYASDISLQGLGTKLPLCLEKGEKLRIRLLLEFELPRVEVQGVVAWSRESEGGAVHGVRFDKVGPVETKTIKLYIDRCLALSPE